MPRKYQQTPPRAVAFRGGAITRFERALVPNGGFSWMQNIRGRHPGFRKRRGQREFNGTAYGSHDVQTLYQFSKGRRTERVFFAQSNNNIYAASFDAPASSDQRFGRSVYAGSASQIPASWANIGDICIYSNGVNQHQLYAGKDNHVWRFVKFDGSAAPDVIPEEGFDYTKEVTDFETTSSADLSSLNTYANNEVVYICTPIPANRLTFDIGQTNSNAATMDLRYHNTSRSWVRLADANSLSDGTYTGTETLSQDGSVTWTFPTDEASTYKYGMSGFWYQLRVGAQLDASVTIKDVTYGTDGTGSGARTSFVPLRNVWDGFPPFAIESRVFKATESVYELYATDSVDVSSRTSSDKVYFNYPDKLEGIYIDVGDTPNETASTTINAVYRWDGDSWAAVSGLDDGTNGMANSGYVTWQRSESEHQTQFQEAKYYSYWYYFTVDKTLSSSVVISIEGMPYFDIGFIGEQGYTSIAWKDRAIYGFRDQFIHVSAKGNPMALNGDDYAILEAGDGRTNRVNCMRRFHNELMVWQEELGVEGGCLTLFEGYSPSTFGKLVLSSKLGCLNAKSAAVVDGVLTSTATDEVIKTLAIFLSHYGVCATDGRVVWVISDDIQNYFDPTKSECIRRGYEDRMWLDHDTGENVIRIGLVSGTSATVPNVFPVFDLVDKTWSFDNNAQELSCMVEVEAASGDIPILQYGGGIDDGKVYRLNKGLNDVSATIDSHLILELNNGADQIQMREVVLQCKSQSTGSLDLTPYRDGVAGSTTTLPMQAENTNEETRTHQTSIHAQSKQISLKIGNAKVGNDMELHKIGLNLYVKERH
jgi:hypothetical protein